MNAEYPTVEEPTLPGDAAVEETVGYLDEEMFVIQSSTGGWIESDWMLHLEDCR